MWTLVALVTLAVAAAQPEPGPAGREFMENNITSIWEHIHELEDRRLNINLIVHSDGGRGRGRGGRGHHGSHHDSAEDDHALTHEETHEETHEDDDHHDNEAHIHLHLHGGGPPGMHKGMDLFHGNPIPGAHNIPVDYVHAICHMHAGSQEVGGTVYLRQDFMGNEPVEFDFQLSGFSAHAHDHAFSVHRYGNLAESCVHVGHVFTPPHKRPGDHSGSHHHSSEEETEAEPELYENGAARAKRDHHGHYNEGRSRVNRDHHGHGAVEGRTEGVLGNLACDDEGNMDVQEEFDSVTIIGFHSIVGRSIVISNTDDESASPLACCQIGWADGSHFGDEDVPWVQGEMDEDHDEAEAEAEAEEE